jgi:hypothetical protein|tara:strand:- start:619 stop:1056 length:438 start_codon:yes stop_codon:yes gene_type:complete
MFRFIFGINLILLLISCSKRINPYDQTFISLNCNNKTDSQKYIFHKVTGELYFYDYENKSLKPLSERFESGYFIESFNELFSYIRGSKLIIKNISYKQGISEKPLIIVEEINLKSLVKKTYFINNDKKIYSNKVRCNWINQKSIL